MGGSRVTEKGNDHILPSNEALVKRMVYIFMMIKRPFCNMTMPNLPILF